MMNSENLVDRVRVASPCPARWEDMAGDDRARFCGQCQKHIFNLSALTRLQVENLIREKEGRLCGRYYQRADGRMLTADCLVGTRQRRSRVRRICGSLIAMFLFLVGARTTARSQSTNNQGTNNVLLGDVMYTNAVPTNHWREIRGEVAVPMHTLGIIDISKKPKATNAPTPNPVRETK